MCTSVCVITSPSAPTCAQLLSLPYTQARAVSCPREDWETLGTCALQKVDLEVSTQYEKPQPRERPRAALCPQAPRVGSTGLGARSRDRAPEPRCNGSRREGAENGTGATSGLHGLLSPTPLPRLRPRRTGAPAPGPHAQRRAGGRRAGLSLGRNGCVCFCHLPGKPPPGTARLPVLCCHQPENPPSGSHGDSRTSAVSVLRTYKTESKVNSPQTRSAQDRLQRRTEAIRSDTPGPRAGPGPTGTCGSRWDRRTLA